MARTLPRFKVSKGGEIADYFYDERLREFRHVDKPWESIKEEDFNNNPDINVLDILLEA